MNNLDHIKNFYPENYKLDLSETMKAALSKVPGAGVVGVGVNAANAVAANVAGMVGAGGPAAAHTDMSQAGANPGVGYVTEKLYMLLQLYLQNKGWNPSAELLQCFSDLKDNAMLPSAAYLQVLANRLTLDAQGRLILRENGKIVLPFEHFANAVMLKHMSGPHGLHLSVDATVRAVIESYTIGRDQFGMEKEFIIEVVQSCPSPACRYYKNHMGISPLPFMDQQFPNVSPADFLHMPHLPPPQAPHPLAAAAVGAAGSAGAGSVGSSGGGSSSASSSVSSVSSVGPGGEVDLSKSAPKLPPQLQHLTKQQQNSIQSQLSQLSAAAAAAAHHQQQQQQLQQQQQQQAQQQQAQQQQAQQQAQQQQQQAQQQAAAAAAAAAAAKHQQQLTAALIQQQNRVLAQQSLEKFSSLSPLEKQRVLAQLDPKHFDPMAVAAAAANLQMQGMMHSQVAAAASSAPSPANAAAVAAHLSNAAAVVPSVAASTAAAASLSNHHAHVHHASLPPPSQSPSMALNAHNTSSASSTSSVSSTSTSSIHSNIETQKNVEALRSNLESLESNKDLLALHNGAWGAGAQDLNRADLMPVGQDKIVRVFAELMRNMARMKTYIRPSMCKPYGKQSESLQKTLMDTIQIVQTLRNCLPAPHIPVTSWKSESEGGNPMNNVLQGNMMPMNTAGVGVGVGVMPISANRVEN